LLVGLHTWSFDRFNQINNLLPLAEKHDFHLLLPEFRGPNRANKNPNCQQACGSQAAKQDIVDAIDYLIRSESVDTENIFLVGLSGGGHMALLMAGFCPEKFRAIAAFVPITDLEKWSVQNSKYGEHVRACCGTDPMELAKRSPVYYLDTIARANLKIFHGKRDSVVPVSHSIELFCRIQQDHPDARVFLDIFDGGHQIDINQAEYWIISQYQKTNIQTVTG
jgi:dipeptidyl aminopeptidase/acylaminoacyl peptidase